MQGKMFLVDDRQQLKVGRQQQLKKVLTGIDA